MEKEQKELVLCFTSLIYQFLKAWCTYLQHRVKLLGILVTLTKGKILSNSRLFEWYWSLLSYQKKKLYEGSGNRHCWLCIFAKGCSLSLHLYYQGCSYPSLLQYYESLFYLHPFSVLVQYQELFSFFWLTSLL